MKKKLFVIGLMMVAAVFAVMVLVVGAKAAGVGVSSGITPPIAVSLPGSGGGLLCPVFNRSLAVGATGDDVTELQNYLHAQGFLSVNATGYFGRLTRTAVAQWQAHGNVVAVGAFGSGTFGPHSRSYLSESCDGTGLGNLSASSTASALSFTGTPSAGMAPLTVQFVVSAPQGTTIGNSVNFGDGTVGTLGFVPVCSNCNAMATVTHTYLASDTYTAELINGTCACPANGTCNCPNLMIVATTTVMVGASSTSDTNTTSSIAQLNEPGNVTLATGGIAEIRNANFYFTLSGLGASTATIDITAVGCWNSFPSDPVPQIHCMIAVVPTPPQTLSVGQSYAFASSNITLTNIANGTAMFAVK